MMLSKFWQKGILFKKIMSESFYLFVVIIVVVCCKKFYTKIKIESFFFYFIDDFLKVRNKISFIMGDE